MMAVIVTSMMVIWVDGQTERCVLIEVRAPFAVKPCFWRRMCQVHWLPLLRM